MTQAIHTNHNEPSVLARVQNHSFKSLVWCGHQLSLIPLRDDQTLTAPCRRLHKIALAILIYLPLSTITSVLNLLNRTYQPRLHAQNQSYTPTRALNELQNVDPSKLDKDWNLQAHFSDLIVITLDDKSERYKGFVEECESVGLDQKTLTVVPGVSREEVPQVVKEAVFQAYSKDDDHKKRLGEAGCHFAHLRALRVAKERFDSRQKKLDDARTNLRNKYNPLTNWSRTLRTIQKLEEEQEKPVLIFEDNCAFGLVGSDDEVTKKNQGVRFRQVLSDLPKDWDMLYLMACCGDSIHRSAMELKDKTHIKRLRYGVVLKSYAVRPHLLGFLINTLEKLEKDSKPQGDFPPVDCLIAELHEHKCKAYVPSPALTYRAPVISDILQKNHSIKAWQPDN